MVGMNVTFFDDPLQMPSEPDAVRIKQIGLFVHENGRKVMFGLELTPFRQRPSIAVDVRNAEGAYAGSLNVIEQLSPNFSLMLHLRDGEPLNPYSLTCVVYYRKPGEEGNVVDRMDVTFDSTVVGEHLFKPEPADE